MNGIMADSIIIRVGHGIMAIPRNTGKSKNNELSEVNKKLVKEN